LLRRFKISLLFFATRIFLTYIQFKYLPLAMLTNTRLKQHVHPSQSKVYGISHLTVCHMVNITLELPFPILQMRVTLQAQKHTVQPYTISTFQNVFHDFSKYSVICVWVHGSISLLEPTSENIWLWPPQII
jgi:hypothetical protein